MRYYPINSCEECPKRYTDLIENPEIATHTCTRVKRVIKKLKYGFPEWCPLSTQAEIQDGDSMEPIGH